MGHVIGPGTSSSGSYGRGRAPFFVVHLIRQHGSRAVVALLVAAALAFLPLAALIWFNFFRLSSAVATHIGQSVVVKPGQLEAETERDEAGKTALLVIKCEVPTVNGWQDLLRYDDPAIRQGILSPIYVRNERVYLRKLGFVDAPFGLLGPPPVSVWLPPGDYEIAVVHEAAHDRSLIDSPQTGFPLVTAFESCTVSDNQKAVQKIRLPHYDWGDGTPISVVGASENSGTRIEPNPEKLAKSIEQMVPIPTPGGYLLSVDEPVVQHLEDHRGCTVDFESSRTIRREWTRNQIAIVRRWLPESATGAYRKLSSLLSTLSQRELFEGWYCYVIAGIAGLVLTNWGAQAMLEPYRRREHVRASLKLCVAIFLFSAAGWWLVGN